MNAVLEIGLSLALVVAVLIVAVFVALTAVDRIEEWAAARREARFRARLAEDARRTRGNGGSK